MVPPINTAEANAAGQAVAPGAPEPGGPASASPSSVDPSEIEKFSAMAAEWWDPEGKFAPLHKFNPVRLGFIPFEGLHLLDIGCGGGLLSEPMARLGFAVTGADAAVRNVETARAHAAESGLAITYRATTAESLAVEGAHFDVILNMEVVEHVADLDSFLRASAEMLSPGGLMIVATLNKTLRSLALAKFAAEYVLGWLPRGTHDWSRFISPATLQQALEQAGLNVQKIQGVSFNP
ncbi:MAG: bifunctional 2-polyprenyl-6-hydroxyphenol methylase/3-demethylubiquinol 3-O-methyltransferase UbiG, partial [Alphaproteobacteria bacterium]|nr:bifunctional 2-polyprenyl-6-hydroxyphenol methylase/3-demethylubiquinol 3-O-methyltransferase UbiG [Alphaproteobacteria bacterium]